MRPLPSSGNPPVVRTDFSNEDAWSDIRRVIGAPVGEHRFLANVNFVDDREYEEAGKEALLPLLEAARPHHGFAMLVDHAAIVRPDHPLLVIDVESGREFRAIPGTVQSIENNLSLGNMDFEEFADSVDADGVFCGFA